VSDDVTTPEDEGFTPELIEHARKTFAGPISFLKSAPALEHLPAPVVPEVAFAGRSNVGKSSLLNALTGRNGLARTSNTPGRTQELNFFDVGAPLAFRLVDMPGYGFAKAPKDVVRKWRFLVNDFLRGRDTLKRALVLIDSRHGIKDVDREILEMLVMASVAAEARKRPAAHPDILATSSEGGMGIPELRAAVMEAVG
jgi:GTP-binding protein